MTDYVAIPGPLGAMLVAADERALLGIWFEGQKYHPDPTGWALRPENPLLARAADQLRGYFKDRGRAGFDLPLAQRGTAFQQAVWAALRRIPAGETWTYGDLAARLGRPAAVRAVGAAVGRNPWSLLVPCHRVVGANGSLTGYAGGVGRKAWLLDWESGRPPGAYSPAGQAVAGAGR